MRPTSEIRRARLLELVEETGAQVAVADRLGKNKNQVYQWLLDPDKPGARNISDASAREIETVFSKPRGWMDTDPAQSGRWTANDRPSGESPAARLDQSIIGSAVALARAMVVTALGKSADFDPHGDIPLFVAAYDLVAVPSAEGRARFDEAIALRVAATRGRNGKQRDSDSSGGRGGV